MKKFFNKFVFILLSLAAILSFQSCGEADGSDPAKGNGKEGRTSAVKVIKLEGQEFVDYFNVVGVVKPIHKASLGYQEGGIIDKLMKEKGDLVRAGDTIVVMDNKAIKANLDAAYAQFELAQVTFEKQEKVYKENINSEFQYLKSKYDRDAAKANYELMKSRFEKTFITAPFSGVIDNNYYEEGEFALPGSPIIYLINSYNLKVVAGVPEVYVGQIKMGDKVMLHFNNILPDPVEGKITYVGTSVVPENRTFPIEVTLQNKSGVLKPELVSVVSIQNQKYDNVMIIPEEVVTRVDEGFIVYVENDGIAEARTIDIIKRFENKIAVRNGLKAGDNLIVVGYQNLVQGERVTRVN